MAVEILSYDNDKYVQVRLPSGDERSIKRGYIYADSALSRRIAGINWHILGGGCRKDFHPRQRKTTFFVDDSDFGVSGRRNFKNKIDAVRFAVRRAKNTGLDVDVFVTRTTKGYYKYSGPTIHCTADGLAFEFKSRTSGASFLRGFGKVPRQAAERQRSVKTKDLS